MNVQGFVMIKMYKVAAAFLLVMSGVGTMVGMARQFGDLATMQYNLVHFCELSYRDKEQTIAAIQRCSSDVLGALCVALYAQDKEHAWFYKVVQELHGGQMCGSLHCCSSLLRAWITNVPVVFDGSVKQHFKVLQAIMRDKNIALEIKELFLLQCPDINAIVNPDTCYFESFLHNFVLLSSDQATLELLLRKGADVNAKKSGPGCDGGTVLHSAAWGGHIELIDSLLRYGADINGRDRWGNTALHEIASHLSGFDAMIAKLIACGASWDGLENAARKTAKQISEARNFAMYDY